MLDGVVYTNKESCEACSACLRVCKTKSIKIKDNKSEIIKQSCLNCGACITVCSKQAKKHLMSIDNVRAILDSRRSALILAPSYVIIARKKYNCTPEQFCSALKQLGFDFIYESSFGADVVTKVYTKYIKTLITQKGRDNTHVIASPCPSLMNFVEKHVPELIDEFAPIMSPMAAQAVLVKHWNDGDLAIIGASPCVAKKSELLDGRLGLYDDKMTFIELMQLIDHKGIIPSKLAESEFDGIQAFYGSGFPVSGGLTKTLELFTDESGYNPIGNDYIILEGEDRSINYLRRMGNRKKEGRSLNGYPLLADILYCEGCILGKAMGVEGDFWENRRIVAEYTQKRFQKAVQQDLPGGKDYRILVKNTVKAPEYKRWLEILDHLIKENKFSRKWEDKHYERKDPTETDLKYILESDGKFDAVDELNCGACGYETCRERAKAVYNGENELGGCIVHIKHESKISHDENIRLQELDKLKSDFLSTVSHELRTPLTSVLGFSKIIKKRLEEIVFPQLDTNDKKVNRASRQIKDNMDIIIAESMRLTSLINDVLDISKMEAGKIEWKMEPLSLVEVIDRAAVATTPLFEQKGITLVKEIETELPEVQGDRDRLIQTLINLISNAVKFTDVGSVTCRAKLIGNEVLVSVIDTGVGIAETDYGNVFEKFKQVGDTLTDKPQGTGLGLPICKQIVEQHGGKIWVESKQGEGCTFSFTVPVDINNIDTLVDKINMNHLIEQMKEQVVTVMPDHNGTGKNILVVDDDNNIRALLRQVLEATGYNVKEAVDGVEAINTAKNEMPDLILLDVMMPRMNGFDVAAVLKNDPVTMHIPIVILSIVEDMERGFRIGVDRYLTKPLNAEELLNEIAILISQGGSKKKVLVVDEDTSALKTLVDVLRTKGYSVVEASDGEECIRKAIEEKPDMIVLDTIVSERHNVVKTLRLERGLENVFFLFTDKTMKEQN